MPHFLKSLCFAGAIILQCNLSAQVIDPVLLPYVRSFEHEAINRGVTHFPHLQCVKFPTMREDSVFRISQQRRGGTWDGVAIFYESGEILVFINPVAFNRSCSTGKEMIVYHELLHAYFRYPHVSGCHLMKEGQLTAADAAYYRDHKKTILDQVFNNISK